MKTKTKAFQKDFLEAANDDKIPSGFWNKYNCNPSPQVLIINRQYLKLRDRLFKLLRDCKKIDPEAFNNIHKGHPYYFIGISSYLLDDVQTAVYFFDAAVTEDINSGAHPRTSPTPSTRFLMLEGAEPSQAAKIITEITEAKFERILKHYQEEITKDVSIRRMEKDTLRNDFIVPCLIDASKPGLRTLVTALITFCIEWDIRNEHFDFGVKSGTSEPFFSHLFRGCLLFESLLIHNPRLELTGRSLGNYLKDPRIKKELKIKAIDTRKSRLDDVFAKVQKYTNTIDETIQITYMARNTLGHNLGWDSSITQEQYRRLYLIIASSLLHVIACLWKQSKKE